MSDGSVVISSNWHNSNSVTFFSLDNLAHLMQLMQKGHRLQIVKQTETNTSEVPSSSPANVPSKSPPHFLCIATMGLERTFSLSAVEVLVQSLIDSPGCVSVFSQREDTAEEAIGAK